MSHLSEELEHHIHRKGELFGEGITSESLHLKFRKLIL